MSDAAAPASSRGQCLLSLRNLDLLQPNPVDQPSWLPPAHTTVPPLGLWSSIHPPIRVESVRQQARFRLPLLGESCIEPRQEGQSDDDEGTVPDFHVPPPASYLPLKARINTACLTLSSQHLAGRLTDRPTARHRIPTNGRLPTLSKTAVMHPVLRACCVCF